MKLRFYWHKSFGPMCCADSDTVLDNLLVDDGGTGIQTTISWINEALSKIEGIKAGEVQEYYWGRETFGALIQKDQVTLDSYIDQEYLEKISLNSFNATLLAWLDFIKAETEVKNEKEIEV